MKSVHFDQGQKASWSVIEFQQHKSIRQLHLMCQCAPQSLSLQNTITIMNETNALSINLCYLFLLWNLLWTVCHPPKWMTFHIGGQLFRHAFPLNKKTKGKHFIKLITNKKFLSMFLEYVKRQKEVWTLAQKSNCVSTNESIRLKDHSVCGQTLSVGLPNAA